MSSTRYDGDYGTGPRVDIFRFDSAYYNLYDYGMTKTVSLRIDMALLNSIDAASKAERKDRSEVVREALELWLKRRTIAEKVRRHREGYARHPVGPNEFAPVLGAQSWPK